MTSLCTPYSPSPTASGNRGEASICQHIDKIVHVKLNSKGLIWEKRFDLQAGQTKEERIEFTTAKREDWTIGQPGGIDIVSTPPGALIYLNGVLQKEPTPTTIQNVQPGKYTIEVTKDLYLPDRKTIEVKSLDFTNTNFELTPNFGRLNIATIPAGANISIDGKPCGTTPYEQPQYTAGKYTIKLTQNQYFDSVATFEIKPGGEFVKTFMLRPDFGHVKITSSPSGATVTLNDQEMGITPFDVPQMNTGKYSLKLALNQYFDDSASFAIKPEGEFIKNFQMRPKFGGIIITSSPSGATITLDNLPRGTTPLQLPQLSLGKHKIRLNLQYYHDLADSFNVKSGDSFSKEYPLKPNFGKMTITSTPSGADVTVGGKSWGRTPVTQDTVISGVQLVKLQLNQYFDEEASVQVADGQTVTKAFTMRPSVGWLTITTTPPGASVTIKDTKKLLGKTPINDLPIDRGTYNLVLEKQDYETIETGVTVTYGATPSVAKDLQRSVGHLKVSTTPQGAKIYVGDEYKGVTPTVIKDLPTGDYAIRLEKTGYDIEPGKVSVKRNQVAEHIITLGTRGTVIWEQKRAKARLLSTFAPGGGQWFSGQYARGAIYSGLFIGGVAVAFKAMTDHSDAQSEYDNAVASYQAPAGSAVYASRYAAVTTARTKISDASSLFMIGLAMGGGAYAAQLVDAWIWGGGEKPVAGQMSAAPTWSPIATTNGNGVQLGVKVQF